MNILIGGSLSSRDLQHFLKSSYNKGGADYKDFKIDTELSGQRVQVYHNPKSKQTVVAHRGTQGFQDWVTDARYGVGDTSSRRFQHSKNIQKKAEQKYGANNVTSIGHSLGSQLAEKSSSKRTKEIITLNKPVSPQDLIFKSVPKKQTDIRTTLDPVSLLRPLQRGNKIQTISSRNLNPLTEHSTDTLKRTATLFGGGLINERCLYCL